MSSKRRSSRCLCATAGVAMILVSVVLLACGCGAKPHRRQLEGDWYTALDLRDRSGRPMLRLESGGRAEYLYRPGTWSYRSDSIIEYRADQPSKFFKGLWGGDGRGPIEFQFDPTSGALGAVQSRQGGGRGIALHLWRR